MRRASPGASSSFHPRSFSRVNLPRYVTTAAVAVGPQSPFSLWRVCLCRGLRSEIWKSSFGKSCFNPWLLYHSYLCSFSCISSCPRVWLALFWTDFFSSPCPTIFASVAAVLGSSCSLACHAFAALSLKNVPRIHLNSSALHARALHCAKGSPRVWGPDPRPRATQIYSGFLFMPYIGHNQLRTATLFPTLGFD